MPDTIFAVSSGRPPAAVSIIRVSGPGAHHAGQQITGSLPSARMVVVRDLVHPRTGELLDRALVMRFDSPASATGEDIVEFQCHGGRAVIEAVLSALASVDGLRAAEPGEFTRRAFENGRIDLTEAEGVADLIEAETETQRKAALALAEGGLRKQTELWRGRLLDLSAAAERAIDYDEDDSRTDAALLGECSALAEELRSWLARPPIEKLKEGVRVVLAGPPNSGKSSLLNALTGSERAIVTEIPGTTRDHIEVPLAIRGMPVLLTDTAGLHQTADVVEAIGVTRASALIAESDVLIWLGHPGDMPDHPRAISVHARCDLAERGPAPFDSLAVSSVTGVGLSALLQAIAEAAEALLPGEGSIALNRRQAALIHRAAAALDEVAGVSDPAVAAELLRRARLAFEQLTGRAGVEDMLDSLFSRFCLGK